MIKDNVDPWLERASSLIPNRAAIMDKSLDELIKISRKDNTNASGL